MNRILVAGASGLIGGHLVEQLLKDGFSVRAVGRRPVKEWLQSYPQAENLVLDLTDAKACAEAVKSMDEVYNLAADIGGVGYIEKNKAKLMLSVLINTNLIQAARDADVKRYFYASSQGVEVADTAGPKALEDGHLWEKLFSERLTRYFGEDFNMETRVGRFQNVYGHPDIYDGGRERAPAALTRKVILAQYKGEPEIEIWGDGTQQRSFVHARDAARGAMALMASDIREPKRIGSNEIVDMNHLADIVIEISGSALKKRHNLSLPRGVERNLTPAVVDERFQWKAGITLREGMKGLYDWMVEDMKQKGAI